MMKIKCFELYKIISGFESTSGLFHTCVLLQKRMNIKKCVTCDGHYVDLNAEFLREHYKKEDIKEIVYRIIKLTTI